MDKLADVSTKDLQAEIERRKKDEARLPPPKPKPLSTPDFDPIIKLCKEYIDDLEKEGCADEDYDQWMFETAMNAVFGNDVWDWTNPILGGD